MASDPKGFALRALDGMLDRNIDQLRQRVASKQVGQYRQSLFSAATNWDEFINEQQARNDQIEASIQWVLKQPD